MALIKCIECGKEISSSAKTCPHCGMNIAKFKTKKNIENIKTKASEVTTESHNNIKKYFKRHKKGIISIIIIIIAVIILSCGYIWFYNYKLDKVKQSLQGRWHDYTKMENGEYLEWFFEIKGDILIDEFEYEHQIKWHPFKNCFVIDEREYQYNDEYSSISYVFLNYTRPYMYDDINILFDLNVDRSESVLDENNSLKGYTKCYGTIKNISDYTFKYIKLEINYMNLSDDVFTRRIHEIRDFKPTEIENLELESEVWFLNTKPQWTLKNCEIKVLEAET